MYGSFRGKHTYDLEEEFNKAYEAAHLKCSKEELVAYDETLNKKGQHKRPSNSYIIFAKEYNKQMKIDGQFNTRKGGARSGNKQAGIEWNKLNKKSRRVFKLASKVMKSRFYDAHPGYKYEPRAPNTNRRGRTKFRAWTNKQGKN